MRMRVHVLSDLHLEFAPFVPPETDADVVVLAGDIDNGARGLYWALRTFTRTPVVYVLGNHEYYGRAIPKLTNSLTQAAAGSNVHLLERKGVEIDGVLFLGCTFWTDFHLFGSPELAAHEAQAAMTDYQRIRVSPQYRRLTPYLTAAWHAQCCNWLKESASGVSSGKAVIVTHHAPSARSITGQHATELVSAAYASNRDALVEECGAALWVHGHTHATLDYVIGQTRVVCNARGYADEPVEGFQPGLVVTL
jgi:predicted phosphodiesterase